MKKIHIICTALLVGNLAFSQQTCDYLVAYNNTTATGEELTGYKTVDGEIIILAKYRHVYTDTLRTIAFVTKDGGIFSIDKKGNTLFEVFIFDNGPDYVREGLFRFVENGKMGFANRDGEKAIPAIFDFVGGFSDGTEECKEEGISTYVMGGYRQYSPSGEYWTWAGGYEHGYINHAGQRFSKVGKLKNSRRKALTTDGKHVVLNRQGEIVKMRD